MKIGKVCLPRALSSPSFAATLETMTTTTTTKTTQPQPQPHPHPRYPDSPRDMVSRINGREKEKEINSSSMNRTFNHHQDQELGNIVEEMNFTRITPANQTLIGGWREEEKIMPLKKRRISFERDSLIIEEEIKNESNIIIDDMGNSKKEENKKWVVSEADDYGDDGTKMEEIEDLRCVRTDGKKWRCKKRRVEGYSYCDHHLKLTRARHKYRKAAPIINAADADDDENKVEGFRKFDNEKTNINGKMKTKARSMNSLLRDTVPLLPLSL